MQLVRYPHPNIGAVARLRGVEVQRFAVDFGFEARGPGGVDGLNLVEERQHGQVFGPEHDLSRAALHVLAVKRGDDDAVLSECQPGDE